MDAIDAAPIDAEKCQKPGVELGDGAGSTLEAKLMEVHNATHPSRLAMSAAKVMNENRTSKRYATMLLHSKTLLVSRRSGHVAPLRASLGVCQAPRHRCF